MGFFEPRVYSRRYGDLECQESSLLSKSHTLSLNHSRLQTLLNCAEGMEYPLHSFTGGRRDFSRGGSNALGETLKGNEYQMEIDDLKRLVGYQALVIDAFKKVDRRGNRNNHGHS